MLLRNEAKVGLLVFGAIVAVIAMYWFLRGMGLGASTYKVYAVFGDARKLDKGADVRMAGVKIGFVDDIRLTETSQARVDMKMWDDACIPVDSVASITTGAFIGDCYVEVMPGSKRLCLKSNQRIKSAEPVNYEKLIRDVGDLVGQLQVAAAGLNSVLADKETMASFKDAIRQLDDVSKSAVRLVGTAQGIVAQASPDIRKTFANVREATGNVTKITNELRLFVADDARPGAREIIAQAKGAVADLDTAIVEAKGVMSKIGGAADRVGGTLTKVDASLQHADEMMTSFKDVSANIKEITSDAEVKGNIKDAIRNAAETTAQAKELLCNLNRRFGGAGGAPVRKASIPDYGFTTDSLWNTSQGTYRFDANYTIGGRNDSFYRAGAFNMGETTRANLQAGRILNDATALRCGIYASRIGFGLDQRIGSCFLLSGDGFRPNDPEYDLRGVLSLGSGFGLYGGVSNVLHDKDVFAGVHYSR